MKLQCSCGAKFDFDVTPEMADRPVQFVCPACGLDASDFVNQLVRQELAQSGAAPVKPAPVRLRVEHPAPRPAEVAPAKPDAPRACPKHPGQIVTAECYVCSKPLCPKCLELFGYVCSPLCRGKAEAQGIQIPVYAGQRAVAEARLWRRTVWTVTPLAALALVLLGFWFWYAWIGGVPRPVFSVTFADAAYSGQSAFAGKDQIIFLRGDTLARHNMKLKQQIWSRRLADQKQIEAAVAATMKAAQAAAAKANSDDPDYVPKMPNPEKLRRSVERAAAAALELRVRGTNIWVLSPGKLVRYDWDTGQPATEMSLRGGLGGLIPCGDELLQVDAAPGKQTITRFNLATGESRTEEIARPAAQLMAAGKSPGAVAKSGGTASPASEMAGLPVGTPGRDAGKPMDPAKVAEQAQHLSYPASIALPAILANSSHQEHILAEAGGQPRPNAPTPAAQPEGDFNLIPTKDGLVQFSVRLLESHITTRTAMKAPPARSVLEGNLTVGRSPELANEMLNQMQRDRGGEVVSEDESRYAVAIQRLDSADAWRGEVIGHPSLFPLTTVNVLTANKLIIVLDKANKQLWQSALNYNITGGLGALDPENAPYGQGPCVERRGALYVADQGVLTAFDLATGNVRWRLPSVGIAGLFFDGQGMIYVNTTTASPESLKYSRQIDINQKTASVIMKLEPRTGKTLWSAQPGGLMSYLSGKFIYTVHSYEADQDEDAEGGAYSTDSIMGRRAALTIKRINPANGHLIWEHCQNRAPYDVRFDKTSIRLIFKREVQVLRFFSL